MRRINIRLKIFLVERSHNIDAAPDGLSGNSFAIASLSTSHLHPLECIALHYTVFRKDHNAVGNALFTSLRPTSALACSIPFYSTVVWCKALLSFLPKCGTVR